MTHEVTATQPETFRGFFRIKGASLVVFDDGELVIDDAYAEGVAEALTEAWEAKDYLLVVRYDDDGRILDTLASMAGYGSPRAAAEAYASDHM